MSVAPLKKSMSVEDVRARAARTLEDCVLHGTTRMRTQVEVDPGIGMRGFEGIESLIKTTSGRSTSRCASFRRKA